MLKHHTVDTLGATLVLLLCGGGLLYLSHRGGIGRDLMSQLAAVMGPIGVITGIGAAIHGRSMPPTHITMPARVWGTLGSLTACVNLWSLGFFQRAGAAGAVGWLAPPALVAAWWLPRRFYGKAPAELRPGLAGFLDALEEVASEHPELFDTDVRERMWEAVEHRYLRLESSYEIPRDLGMSTKDGNARLRAVLEHHLKDLVTIADALKLDTEDKRRQSLLDSEVRSQQEGLTYDAFLGSP